MEFTVQWNKYQKVFLHPLTQTGLIPEEGSEIFVKNIPPLIDEQYFINFFKKVGEVFKMKIMIDENGIETRGFGYVTYTNSTMATRAVNELNNVEYQEGCFLFIESSLNNCRIFMGGIPTHKSKDDVWRELNKRGIQNISDVIMYRSYTERSENRGFVFLEFHTHEQAAYFRAKYHKHFSMWGCPVIIDWSVPMPAIDREVLEKVKIIYLRNLVVTQTPQEFEQVVYQLIDKDYVTKIYKFKNYAFVHLKTRELAENLMEKFREFYRDTVVEIEWAKPSTKFTSPEYRQLKLKSLSRCRTISTNSSSSNSSRQEEPSSSSSTNKNPEKSLEKQYTSLKCCCHSTSPKLHETRNYNSDLYSPTNMDQNNNYSSTSSSPVPGYVEFSTTPSSRCSTPNQAIGSLNTPFLRRRTLEQQLMDFHENNWSLLTQQSDLNELGLTYDPIREYQRILSNIYGK